MAYCMLVQAAERGHACKNAVVKLLSMLAKQKTIRLLVDVACLQRPFEQTRTFKTQKHFIIDDHNV